VTLTNPPCDLASAPGGNDPFFILVICGPLRRLHIRRRAGLTVLVGSLTYALPGMRLTVFLLPNRVIQKDSGGWEVLLAYGSAAVTPFVLLVILLFRHGAPVALAGAPRLHA